MCDAKFVYPVPVWVRLWPHLHIQTLLVGVSLVKNNSTRFFPRSSPFDAIVENRGQQKMVEVAV